MVPPALGADSAADPAASVYVASAATAAVASPASHVSREHQPLEGPMPLKSEPSSLMPSASAWLHAGKQQCIACGTHEQWGGVERLI